MSGRMAIDTPFGPTWLWGRDTGKPVMLVIHGAFAPKDGIGRIAFSAMDIFEAHLPGNHCPALVDCSLGVWAAAYRAAIGHVFPDRPVMAVGVSTGALVALALRAPEVRQLVLLEPPLRPYLAWPFRLFPSQTPAWGEEMNWRIFGVGHDRFERRDYSHLLGLLTVPTIVLAGGVPLMPERESAVLPSLLDERSREELASHPLVDLRIAPGAGHNIPRDGEDAMLKALIDGEAATLQAGRRACAAEGPPA